MPPPDPARADEPWSPKSAIAKRLFDLVLSVAGLLVLSPLFALTALAIKLDSPGPVFFRQERVGRGGVRFRIFKFRTMRTEQAPGSPELTVAGDRRVTRVGSFLRRYKLDELPQLIDVARGTMSLVGPRPEVPRYVDQYPPERRAQLLSVRPGITDFAALRYRRESELLAQAADPEREYLEVIMPHKLRVAGTYIEHASLRSDLLLLGLTLRALFDSVAPIRRMDRFMGSAGIWQRLDTLLSHPWRYRVWLVVAYDAAIVLGAWHATYLFRLGFERWQPGRPWYDDYVSMAVVLVYLACIHAFGARRALWRYFGFDDFRRLALACLCAGAICASGVLYAQLVGVSRAVLVLHPLFALVALVLSRMVVRVVWEHAHGRAAGDDGQRRCVIVVGASLVARRLLAGLHLRHGWHVVLMLDDDPTLHGMRIGGVTVVGGVERLRDPALTHGATHVVVTIGRAQAAERDRALALAHETGLVVLTVPEAGELEAAPS